MLKITFTEKKGHSRLGRSRSWLLKWVGRYNNLNKNSEKEWFREESRAPGNVHRKTDSEIEQLVVNVRKSLMEGKTKRHEVSVHWSCRDTISDA